MEQKRLKIADLVDGFELHLWPINSKWINFIFLQLTPNFSVLSSHSLIINHSLESGTQIPYINKGRDLGYEVLLTNTNDNYRKAAGGGTKGIKGSRSPTEHAASVFEKYIIPSEPDAVAIVAHSYGGVVTVELAQKFPEFFKEKVFAVGFTDSVHSSSLVPEVLIRVRESIRRQTKVTIELLTLICISLPVAFSDRPQLGNLEGATRHDANHFQARPTTLLSRWEH